MPSAQQHRRAANQIKKRFRSKFPDASNLLERRQQLPPQFATRGPPSKSDVLATVVLPTRTLPTIEAETVAAPSPTTSPPLSTQTSTSSTSTTTTTTTTTSTSASTTPTKTKPVKTGPATTAVTTLVTTSLTSTSAEAVVTSSAAAAAVAPTGGSSSGAIAGGVITAILAIAGIIFAIFFIRRQRKRKTEENDFDAKDFRPSAMLMPDPPTHEDTVAHGFNPRPPSMIERPLESPPATFGAQYGTPAPVTGASAYGEDYAGYNPGAQFASFAPGQVVNYNVASKPLPNPFATPTVTPLVSPIAGQGQYEQQAYTEYASLTRQLSAGSTTTYPVLTRQSSLTNPHQENVAVIPAIPVTQNAVPDNDYVDLSRSSVSPFQAAQYAEISRHLKTEVPSGLTTPEAAQSQFAPAAAVDRDLPPLPPPKDDDEDGSPFADPDSTPSTPTNERPRVSTTPHNEQQQQYEGELRPISTAESVLSQEADFPQDLEFPVPPSPVHTISSRYRVDSTPPSLPEILVESRVSVGSYEFAPPPGFTPSPLGSGFPSGVSASGFMNRFPATPSPLASSFGIITPGPEKAGFEEAYITPPPSAKKEKLKESSLKRSNTVYSIYDGEDAYGGI